MQHSKYGENFLQNLSLFSLKINIVFDDNLVALNYYLKKKRGKIIPRFD